MNENHSALYEQIRAFPFDEDDVVFPFDTRLLLLPVVLWISWPRILFMRDFESLGRNEQGYRE